MEVEEVVSRFFQWRRELGLPVEVFHGYVSTIEPYFRVSVGNVSLDLSFQKGTIEDNAWEIDNILESLSESQFTIKIEFAVRETWEKSRAHLKLIKG